MDRTYLRMLRLAISTAFGHTLWRKPWRLWHVLHRLRPVLRTAFGLKIHFIVKFSRKSLSEWFSCRTFAPRWRQEGGRGKEASRIQQVPQEVAKAEDGKRVTRVQTSCKCTLSAKQSEKCHIAHSAHIKNTAKQADKCRFLAFWACFVCFAVSCKDNSVKVP